MAFRAATIGQLDIVITARAIALSGQTGVNRWRSALALKHCVTTRLSGINRLIDRATIGGETTVVAHVWSLAEIHKVQRIVEARIDVIEVHAPIAEEAGLRTKGGRERKVGVMSCNLVRSS